MKTKKNTKVDLRKKSSLFFLIGLCLALLISWRAIEYRQYRKKTSSLEELNIDLEEEEDVGIIENLIKIPPSYPPYPPIPTSYVYDFFNL